MDLLYRLDDVHAGKWKAQRSPKSFDRWSRANQEMSRYRRNIKSFPPIYW